ncbi:MAG: glycosyltransferase family 4 protein [Patescibacteria group bacterium]
MRKVISIGYGRHIFEVGNNERRRLMACAEAVGSFDMVIFSKPEHGLVTGAVSNKLTLYPTNSKNNILALLDAFLLVRALIKNSPEPVTLTTQDPFETALIGILIKRLYGVKLIIQEHGDFFGTPDWRRETSLNRPRYLFGLWALKQADVVRVVSKRSKEHLVKQGIKNTVILPVSIDFGLSQSDTISPLVREIFPLGSFVFLSAARFVKQKNLPLLLEAFFAAQKEAPQVRLLLVGQGAEESHLRKLIKKHSPTDEKLVQILPWSSDLAALMRAADAYVLTSNYEGWARVLVEAMLTKLPIITTEVGCAGEVVVDKVHGMVVPVNNKNDLKEALCRLATDGDFYRSVKQNLAALSSKAIPGTDDSTYAAQWADIFG